ncbi:MAG: diaminopimelate decarboxylase [Alphaproteobacteria bacterium]|nr:diaminopimelate decarboxylase [Alphaproteobacteria bacterium]
MHHFAYRSGVLHCEDVSLEAVARELGTPAYVYSDATLRRHYKVLADAFKGQPHLIAYAVKANSNLGVIATLAALGAGADVVSGGELLKAIEAGVPASRIVFSGVGKTHDELALGLRRGIHQFNVESLPELHRLSRVAVGLGIRAPMAFRVNPHVDAGGHAHISTGSAEHKFGIAWHEADAFYDEAIRLPGIDPVGVAVHIGSQIMSVTPFREAWTKVAALARSLRERGFPISRVDFGGGLGVPYKHGDDPDSPSLYARQAREVLGDLDVELILEPGRLIAGNAGVMISRVEYVKERDGRTFVILDAGMNDLLRPALYGAHHDILPVRTPEMGANPAAVDIVGPVCESADRFARDRPMPPLKEGDLVAFMTAGAYGATLSSQYNSRPMVAEALVRGDACVVVRRRPTFEDMIALERAPDWIKRG